MSYAGRVTKLLGRASWAVTVNTSGAYNAANLSPFMVSPKGLNLNTTSFWYEFYFGAVAMGGTARNVTVFGINLGSINNFPATITTSPYQRNYRTIDNWFDPVINPAYGLQFGAVGGPTLWTMSVFAELWGWGEPFA